MTSLFNGQNSDDDEGELKINTGYANNYNSWRQKEEFSKLKTKYGEHIKSSGEESETSSDEDEDAAELTEQLEKDFYKTLACLKNKDPKIYDDNVKFFDDKKQNENDDSEAPGTSKKSKKEKKLFLRDYERQIVMERGGKFSDSDDEDTFHRKKRETRVPTYVEEQRALKESISKALNDDDEEEESGLLKPKAKTESDKLKEEEAYKEWLKGQPTEIDNGEKEALKPLRDFWTNPKLDPKEKFLRDYILNKRFLDKDGGEDYLEYDQMVHDSDENLSEDEKNIEKQEEFEHKYNFRFEEPDQEFIKRYPRTLEDTLRKKDTRRSQKRAEVKQRKESEKVRKQEELKQLKAMKRKEIEEKIEKLKEITGNDDIRFSNIDLDGDFDPAEHDRKMQELFNEEYYDEDEDVKPEFPEIDEELGIDRNWDDYDPGNDVFVPDAEDARAANADCEDSEFNMDADYDPTKSLQSELIDASRKKKKRRRSKFAEVIAKDKPKFDPSVHSSYRDYIEQYYALDYEDMIDDLPCRFKYRQVVPNDYGLSVEEILMADDRELNKWCSLKKALEHKPKEVEMREVLSYKQKAASESYKKKILKSLYTPEEETQDPTTAITLLNQKNDEPPKKKRKPKKKKPSGEPLVVPQSENIESASGTANGSTEKNEAAEDNEVPKVKKQKKAKFAVNAPLFDTKTEETIEVPKSLPEKSKKRKVNKTTQPNHQEVEEPPVKKSKPEKSKSKKSKTGESQKEISQLEIAHPSDDTENSKDSRKKLKKNKQFNRRDAEKSLNSSKNTTSDPGKKRKKQSSGASGAKKQFKNKNSKETDQVALLSSERLKAYGLNPKKFKNKLKYVPRSTSFSKRPSTR